MDNIICNLITYITYNTKDFANICFLVLTSILAVKTYINAKKTLFNPIRSEMVKYQMKVITDFIDNHTSKGLNLDFSIDYFSLIKINLEADYLLNIYTNEYLFENHTFDDVDTNRLIYCTENLAGLFEVIKKEDIHYFETTVIGDFEITKQYIQTTMIKSKEEANPDLDLQRLYFTKKFYSIYSDLLNLKTNPFIPKEIKVDVENILNNITRNLIALYNVLSNHIAEQKDTSYYQILDKFNERKISHQTDLEKLRKGITEYFKVNGI
jgi:hypothetical protein